MYEFLQELDLFLRIKFIIFVPSLLCLMVISVSEYLKGLQYGKDYQPPKLISVFSLFIYLTSDSFVSMIMYLFGYRGIMTDIVGLVLGAVVVLIVKFCLKKAIIAFQNSENSIYKELEGSKGVIVKAIRRTSGGVVAIKHNDRTIEAAVICEDRLPRGEKVRIIGSTKDSLICVKDE